MTLPKITYPDIIDTDTNTYVVKDSLVTSLAKDYNIGDKTIVSNASIPEMTMFPPSGIITLTDQCAEIDERAISFFYNSKDNVTGTFNNIEILEGFPNVSKKAKITTLTMNVVAQHHNAIKDSIINIEKFSGIYGDVGLIPKVGSLEERINYLRSVALKPKAWILASKKIGIIPFTVDFTDLSFRTATDNADNAITTTWDFGDGDVKTFNYKNDSDETLSSNQIITKIYEMTGVYTVKYTIKNKFGSDSLIFEDLIDARFPAPDVAEIHVDEQPYQSTTGLTVRAPTNSLIYFRIPSGINPSTGRTYAGEEVDQSENAIDPVEFYNWNFSDDLTHGNDVVTTALYDTGGIFDIILRCDTLSNSFRITTVNDAIDIIENKNIWMWLYKLLLYGNQSTSEVQVTEFGLISETFKTPQTPILNLGTDNSFLNGKANEDIQKYEFARNVGFCPATYQTSGFSGNSYLFWASGRTNIEPRTVEEINVNIFNGFEKTYSTQTTFLRPYNWTFLNTNSFAYFMFGLPSTATVPFSSPTNLNLQVFNLITQSVSNTTFNSSNFQGTALDLTVNPSSFNPSTGENLTGDFSIYRTTWKNNAGYILRNIISGTNLRIFSFYGTISTVGNAFSGLRKLTDIAGSVKLEGDLVNMSNGLFFFNNSGSISVFDDIGSVWYTAGTGNNSVSFVSLQDKSVIGFNDENNTLLATSDNDHLAYISYDYSPKTFIKFNNIDLTFSSLPNRTRLKQWHMGNY